MKRDGLKKQAVIVSIVPRKAGSKLSIILENSFTNTNHEKISFQILEGTVSTDANWCTCTSMPQRNAATQVSRK